MHTWGATVVASPSEHTNAGRSIRAEHPDSPGSLGIAISEAVEDAAGRADTAYSLGSVLNHVLLHQTVIGQEALRRWSSPGTSPTSSSAASAGLELRRPRVPVRAREIAGRDIDVLATEPAACPTLTRGPFAYDFGDTSKLTPLVPMHTLGHDFVPAPIHAGGLRYHGVGPLLSQLVLDGLVRAEAYPQNDVFASALLFAASEGIVPRPRPRTRFTARSSRPGARTRRAGSGRSFSTSPAMATSTWPRTTTTSPGSSSTSRWTSEIERALRAIEALPKPA